MAAKYWTGKADLYEIDFDNGGGGTQHVPVAGEVLYVNGSEATEYATVQAWSITGGAWATDNAAGKMWVYSATAAFIANLEENEELEDADANVVVDITAVAIADKSSGDWQVAGNWGTGEDPAVPLAADEVIFDSRSSLAPTEGMLDSESGAAAQCTYDLLHFKKGYTAGVASAAEPLCCSPVKLVIEGTGTYYILCGEDDQSSDAAITTAVIANSAAIVYLYSNANDAANLCEYKDVFVTGGTVHIAYYDIDTDETGCFVDNLYIVPANNNLSAVTVYIEKDGYDHTGALDEPEIVMANGKCYCDSQICFLHLYGGTFYFGTDLGASPETDLDITDELVQYGGTFYWQPDDSGNDAYINKACIFGGKFDASGTTNNNRSKVLGAGAGKDIYVFSGAIMYLNNDMGNISLAANSKLINYGGIITLDSGTSIGITYDT